MRLSFEQLNPHLQSGKLAPVYLISGDEPLQMMEATDAIRSTAKQHGFDERSLLEVTQSFDWNYLFQEADNLSLFATQRLIELRLNSHKPGIDGGKALVGYCNNPPPDTLLVISAAKIDKKSQKTRWFKALEDCGAIIQIWPVDTSALPEWIRRRFSRLGREISPAAASYLADHVEGNMLAASQEVEIIALLTEKPSLDLNDVISVGDSTRFDVFKLMDTVLEGEADRVIRILDGLRSEGLEPIIIHWAIHRELHSLYTMSTDIANGEPVGRVMQKHRVWSSRTNAVRSALQRHKPAGLKRLIISTASLERLLKGVRHIKTDPWIDITWLCLRIAGVRLNQGLLRSLAS